MFSFDTIAMTLIACIALRELLRFLPSNAAAAKKKASQN